jgi:hypothetical protein
MKHKQVIYEPFTMLLKWCRGSGEKMKNLSLAIVMVVIGASQTYANCLESKAYFLNEQPLPERTGEEIDVLEPEGEEGGSFLIYRNAKAKPDRIRRIDFSPLGRHLVTLAIGAPNDIMITDTQEYYIAPFDFINREERVYYFFCDGKLKQEPGADLNTDYAVAAKRLADAMFNAPEIAKQLKESGAMTPVWK